MKVHIVFDQPSYETATIIAAYADRRMAENRVAKMKRQKERWLEVQRQKESNSEEDAYCGAPPHEFDDLGVMTLRVIQNAHALAEERSDDSQQRVVGALDAPRPDAKKRLKLCVDINRLM